MTKTQVHALEIKVAVIQNDIVTLKDDTKSVKGLLRWFLLLTVAILGLVGFNTWDSSGDRKVQNVLNMTIEEALKHNSEVIGDMAAQGIEKGWYKPTSDTYRSPDTKKGDI